MLASLYVAGVCLVMFLAVQAVLVFDVPSEFGRLGRRVGMAACYVLSFTFLVGFVAEIARVVSM
jgi:hypothetical protein